MGSDRAELLGLRHAAAGATSSDRRNRPRPRWRLARLGIALTAAWLAVIVVAGGLLGGSQDSSRDAMLSRLQARTNYAASFISVYARDLLTRERAAAGSWLADPRVSQDTLARVASALELRDATLLDGEGRPIATEAEDTGSIDPLLPAWSSSVAGGGPASRIWLENVGGSPVIGFAIRYTTAAGPRVFAGATTVAGTVVPSVLGNVLSTPGWQADLVDPDGGALAAGRPGGRRDDQVPFSAAVTGTPWRIVIADSRSELYGVLGGPGQWLPWVALAGLAVAGLALLVLVARLARQRTRLTELNADLARLAAVDPLTGLRNRRAIEQYLHDALSAARRHDLTLSLLVVDVDHFKTINDRLGHRTGDAVLTHTAQVLDAALRAEDAIGRWGGEEFLVVLPGTDEEGALSASERLREALAAHQPEEVMAHDLPVTVTIGVAEWQHEEMSELISRADGALYAGKAAGRDTAQVSHGGGPVAGSSGRT
jgi:diguanylate cyclase (GGDEF)-like protein